LADVAAAMSSGRHVPQGDLLIRFVDGVLRDSIGDLDALRRDVRRELGDAGFVDACATIASFNAVVKVADGTGIPIEDWKAERTQDIRAALDIDALRRE
jgi:hypothetical protein